MLQKLLLLLVMITMITIMSNLMQESFMVILQDLKMLMVMMMKNLMNEVLWRQ